MGTADGRILQVSPRLPRPPKSLDPCPHFAHGQPVPGGAGQISQLLAVVSNFSLGSNGPALSPACQTPWGPPALCFWGPGKVGRVGPGAGLLGAQTRWNQGGTDFGSHHPDSQWNRSYRGLASPFSHPLVPVCSRFSRYDPGALAVATSSPVGAACGHSVHVDGVGACVAGRRSVLAPGSRTIAHPSLLRVACWQGTVK